MIQEGSVPVPFAAPTLFKGNEEPVQKTVTDRETL
jgi:hypothetical protein